MYNKLLKARKVEIDAAGKRVIVLK